MTSLSDGRLTGMRTHRRMCVFYLLFEVRSHSEIRSRSVIQLRCQKSHTFFLGTRAFVHVLRGVCVCVRARSLSCRRDSCVHGACHFSQAGWRASPTHLCLSSAGVTSHEVILRLRFHTGAGDLNLSPCVTLTPQPVNYCLFRKVRSESLKIV